MNKWELGDEVSLPGDGKKYIVYKIGFTRTKTEYILWDGVADYPGWYEGWQLTKYEGGMGFKTKE